jgi:hypothetical protein
LPEALLGMFPIRQRQVPIFGKIGHIAGNLSAVPVRQMVYATQCALSASACASTVCTAAS